MAEVHGQLGVQLATGTSQIFVGRNGLPMQVFVDPSGIDSKTRMAAIKKIKRAGGQLCIEIANASFIIVGAHTSEALAFARSRPVPVLSLEWISKCVNEGVFIAEERNYGGYRVHSDGKEVDVVAAADDDMCLQDDDKEDALPSTSSSKALDAIPTTTAEPPLATTNGPSQTAFIKPTQPSLPSPGLAPPPAPATSSKADSRHPGNASAGPRRSNASAPRPSLPPTFTPVNPAVSQTSYQKQPPRASTSSSPTAVMAAPVLGVPPPVTGSIFGDAGILSKNGHPSIMPPRVASPRDPRLVPPRHQSASGAFSGARGMSLSKPPASSIIAHITGSSSSSSLPQSPRLPPPPRANHPSTATGPPHSALPNGTQPISNGSMLAPAHASYNQPLSPDFMSFDSNRAGAPSSTHRAGSQLPNQRSLAQRSFMVPPPRPHSAIPLPPHVPMYGTTKLVYPSSANSTSAFSPSMHFPSGQPPDPLRQHNLNGSAANAASQPRETATNGRLAERGQSDPRPGLHGGPAYQQPSQPVPLTSHSYVPPPPPSRQSSSQRPSQPTQASGQPQAMATGSQQGVPASAGPAPASVPFHGHDFSQFLDSLVHPAPARTSVPVAPANISTQGRGAEGVRAVERTAVVTHSSIGAAPPMSASTSGTSDFPKTNGRPPPMNHDGSAHVDRKSDKPSPSRSKGAAPIDSTSRSLIGVSSGDVLVDNVSASTSSSAPRYKTAASISAAGTHSSQASKDARGVPISGQSTASSRTPGLASSASSNPDVNMDLPNAPCTPTNGKGKRKADDDASAGQSSKRIKLAASSSTPVKSKASTATEVVVPRSSQPVASGSQPAPQSRIFQYSDGQAYRFFIQPEVKDRAQLLKACTRNGGLQVLSIRECEYVILQHRSTGFALFLKKAVQDNKTPISPTWIYKCIEAGALVAVDDFEYSMADVTTGRKGTRSATTSPSKAVKKSDTASPDLRRSIYKKEAVTPPPLLSGDMDDINALFSGGSASPAPPERATKSEGTNGVASARRSGVHGFGNERSDAEKTIEVSSASEDEKPPSLSGFMPV